MTPAGVKMIRVIRIIRVIRVISIAPFSGSGIIISTESMSIGGVN